MSAPRSLQLWPCLHLNPALTLPYSAAACTYSPSSNSEAASARYTLLRCAALQQ